MAGGAATCLAYRLRQLLGKRPCAPTGPKPDPTRAGEPLPTLELGAVRGLAGIKEAAVRLPVNAATVKGGCAGKEVRAGPRGGEPAGRAAPCPHGGKSGAYRWRFGAAPCAALQHWPAPPACLLALPCQIRVAVASGIGNARQLLKRMQSGEAQYDFVEASCSSKECQAGQRGRACMSPFLLGLLA